MIHAYDEKYLDDAMHNLGEAFDCARNVCQVELDDFLAAHHWSSQQAQDYILLPLTMGAAMYCSGKTASCETIEVNRGLKEPRTQLTTPAL